jgi:ABC-type thiamine transport system substrate-binding protein
MARKIPEEKKEEIRLRDELERMLQDGIDDLQLNIDSARDLLPAREGNFMDYEKVKTYADTKADNIVDSISEFYLSTEIIEEIPYVKQKSVVDKITVSNLLFQMKTAEHAIIKLLEEIDNGNLHPRTFEVLASLQRSKMEIVKHLAQFMVIMENNYKSLKEDYRIKKADEPLLIDTEYDENPKAAHQVRGTKQMIEMLRDAIPEKRATANPNDTISVENLGEDVK